MELTPKHEIKSRTDRLLEQMTIADIHAVMILGLTNQFYFSGSVQQGLVYISLEKAPMLLVQKSFERSRAESALENIIKLEKFSLLKNVLSAQGIKIPKRIGLELDIVPVSTFKKYETMFPDTEWVDVSGILMNLRSIKSEYEIQQIEKAADLVMDAFMHVPEMIREGKTEIEIAAEFEYFMMRNGHQGIIRTHKWNMELFFGNVGAGTSPSIPVYFDGPVGAAGLNAAIGGGPSQRRIKRNESILIDMVGAWNGYLADMTRMYSIGEPPAQVLKAHDCAMEISKFLETAMVQGAIPSELFLEASAIAQKRGFADTFMNHGDGKVKFVGHGIGLELDELPVLAGRYEKPLEQGMVIACEPKILSPEWGSAGTENTYILTSTGTKKMTGLPDEFIIL